MAAPKGNQFWKLRSKHGRDKLFATPELPWETACEYFDWIDNNPLIEIDYVGKDATQVEKPHTRPYTLEGLVMYLDACTNYWKEFRKRCNDNNEKDFIAIITRIEEIIRRQKFEGAACGFYNANIIARDLGLSDKKDLSSSDGTMSPKPIINVVSPKTKEQLDRLINE